MAQAIPFIQAAATAKMAIDADRARREANAARDAQLAQQRQANAQIEAQMAEQTKAQQMAAEAAKSQLQAQQAQYAEQKAQADTTAKQMADQLATERQQSAEREASRIRARVRGGRRSLLSDTRLTPEVGMLGGSSNLGQ